MTAMRPWLGLVALLLLLAPLAPLAAWAGEAPAPLTLLSLGRAPAALANEAAAREAAVQDALRRGVTQAALDLGDPALVRPGLEALENQVLAKYASFVSAYTPQNQVRGPAGAAVLVSLNINRAALTKALAAAGLVNLPIRLPAILVLVSQEAAPGAAPVFWWAEGVASPTLPAAMVKVARAHNLPLVEPAGFAPKIPPTERQAVLAEAQAAALGKAAGAGLVVLGRLRPHAAEAAGAPPLAQLMALDPNSGQVLATEETEAPVLPAGPEAQEKAAALAEAALTRLLRQAAANLPEGAVTETLLPVEIAGLRSLGDLVRFEAAVRKITSLVVEVRRESIGGGKAGLKVKLRGGSERLAQELMAANYGDFLVNVVQSGPEGVKLVLVPKTQ
ncbi:MAG: hypothetical protein V1797_18425 [Pseudomonadota bacterium]